MRFIPGGHCSEQGCLAGLPHSSLPEARGHKAPRRSLPVPRPPRRVNYKTLFTLSDLDFNTWLAFGSTGYGCAEFGELVTAVNQVNAAGASYQAYYDAFLALARRTEALAAGELASGHTASAQSAYLRASTYYDMCLYFILGTAARAQEAELYVMMERCWHLASQLFDPPFEPVRIPYGNTSWAPSRCSFLAPRLSTRSRPLRS